jgi:hypothetical protein
LISTPHELRERFFREFATLTQHIYLCAFAAVRLPETDFEEVATDVAQSCKSLLSSADEYWNDAIEGRKQKLEEATKTFPKFMLELLIVRLDSTLHALLDELDSGVADGEKQCGQFEQQLAPLRTRAAEAYRWVILLAEIRNAIVHNGGRFGPSRFQRLRDAGWSQPELDAISKEQLTLSHVLRMKGAVRTAANIALELQGSKREDLP